MSAASSLLACASILVNVASLAVLALILDGVDRKVRARVQRRVGPPILQTLYDVLKLYRRPVTRDELAGPFHSVAPALAFATSLVGAAVIPSLLPTSGFQGDLIVAVYLISSVSAITSFGAASSGIPFSVVGGWREASLMMTSELVLGATVAAIASSSGSLMLSSLMPLIRPATVKVSPIIALASLALLTYVEGGRLPFEIAEAEPELAGGVASGYGGPPLALLMHSLLLKRVLLAALFLDLLVPWNVISNALGAPLGLAVRALAFTLALTLVSLVSAVIEALYGRCRPGHAISLVKKALIISGVALIAACVGF